MKHKIRLCEGENSPIFIQEMYKKINKKKKSERTKEKKKKIKKMKSIKATF